MIWGLCGNWNAQASSGGEKLGPIDAKVLHGHGTDAVPQQRDWWSEVQKNIRDQEYHVTYQRSTSLPDITEAYHAPNRAQNLRTYFTSDGIEIIRRTETSPTWRASMKLEGVRRGDVFEGLPIDTGPVVTDSRIEYRRGPIIEWYVNKPDGLEQGFTISTRLEGDGNLELIFRLQGNLNPEISLDNQAVDFFTLSNVLVLRYSDLHVIDATGRFLSSYLELAGKELRIIISDRNASFPIIVDPLLTSPSWTSESNQTSAHFGYSVGTAGDVNGDGYSDVIVGAPNYDAGQTNEGRAYLYYGDASGLLTTGYWTAEGNIQYAYFGRSVGTAGDVNDDGYSDVIIGMPFNDNNSASNEERAFVYHGSETGPSSSPDWTGQSSTNGDWYGGAVSTAGDVNGDGFSDVIVGARLYGAQLYDDNGSAFVYYGSTNGLSSNPGWSLFYSQTGAEFGNSVSFAGDVNGDGYDDVVIGTYSSAFAFHGSQGGLSAGSNWTVSTGGIVAGTGDVNGDGYSDVVVGNPNWSSSTGRIYVYHGGGSGLSTSTSPELAGEQTGALFGASFGTAGDINGDGYADIIVGAYAIDKAYAFKGSYTGLKSTAIWEQSSQANSDYGFSVHTAGDVNGDGYSDVIVGARNYDSGQTDEGRAFVYHGAPDGLDEAFDWGVTVYSGSAQFGYAVSEAGDVNGDGYGDVIVGANGYDNGSTDEGAAFVYTGSATGLNTSAAWMFESNQSTAFLGESVGSAGDVNGDGYDDVIIGAPYYTYGQTDEGKVFVCYGSSGGLGANGNPTTADWTAESNQASAWFGISTGSAGDVNGDSCGDIIIGATGYDSGHTNEGKVFVFHGSSTGLGPLGTPINADWTGESNQTDAQFGSSVNTAGDVNGDGFSDIIIGAQFYDNGQNNEGKAFVYLGATSGLGPSGTPANADWDAESDQASAEYGCSVSTAGDVNGDGFSDVIVGAFRFHYFDWMEGAAFVYHGSPGGLSATANWDDGTEAVNSRYGYSVSDAGDVNGDGYGDVVVGATQFGSPIYEGTAFVYYGSHLGLSVAAAVTYDYNQENAYLGCSVSSAGDVNGDGYSDIIVGAYAYDVSPDIDTGAAFVRYGGMDRGRPINPRQLKVDGATPISAMGMSDSESSFIISGKGSSPMGRQDVQLEYEIKSQDVPFNGLNTFVSGWHDSGTGGYPFSESVSDLIGHTAYHWRMRLRYAPGNPMGLMAGRWFSPFPGQMELIDFHTNNAPPIGGYTSDNSIPAEQVSQSTDGDGIITVRFRIKDGGRNICTLQNYNFYVDAWHTPLSTDSGCLGGGWPDNNGSLYMSEPDWSGTIYSFTFDTKHSDVASYFIGADNPNVRIRFRVNDGLDTGDEVYTQDFRVDNLAPTTGSIVITDNAGYTNDSTPSLSLSSNGADDMRFALSEGGAWTDWYSYNTSFSSYDISTGGNGPKTVWVEFKDQFGNVQTMHASDSTTYDTSPLVDSVAAISNDITPTWTWSSTGGIGLFRYKLDDDNLSIGATPTAGTSYTPSFELSDGLHTLYVQEQGIEDGWWSFSGEFEIEIDSGLPCSEASVPLSVDEENITFDITYTSGDVYDFETCGAGTGSGLAQVALYVKVPGGSYEPVEIDLEGDIDGVFEYTVDVDKEGSYYFYTLATDNAGNVEALPGQGYDAKTFYSSKFSGYAILAVGSIATDPDGLLSHSLTANNIYTHLVNRHFTLVDDPGDPLDYIRYYNPYGTPQPGEDEFVGSYKDVIRETIATYNPEEPSWILEKMRTLPGPLYITLVDHGSPDEFYLDGTQSITAQELDEWLDDLEQDMAGEGIPVQDIIIILGTCYSGSFINDLAGEHRVIITSAASDEPSYRGPMTPSGVRDGEYFLGALFNKLGQGSDFRTSFQYATQLTEAHTYSGIANELPPHNDTALQHPHLEDDYISPYGSNELVPGGDGDRSGLLYLGCEECGTGSPGPIGVEATGKMPQVPLGPSVDDDEALVWVRIKSEDMARVNRVWVEIRSPHLILETPPGGNLPQQEVTLEEMELNYAGNDTYQEIYDGFIEAGRYTVFVYAEDTDNIIWPLSKLYVYKEREEANEPPATFNLIYPQNSEVIGSKESLGASWTAAIDPDPPVSPDWSPITVTYTIEIRNDPADWQSWGTSTFSYKREGIIDNFCVIGSEGQFIDERDYLWKVTAVDLYGAERITAESGFSIDDNNTFPGYLDVSVYDSSNDDPIDNATITSSGSLSIAPLGNGQYFGISLPGMYTFSFNASGYTVETINSGVTEGGVTVLAVGLSPMSPENFGNVDGDTDVDLADAIMALQIIVGLHPDGVYLDADVDGDGMIGMPELKYILQKVAGLR